MAQPSVVPKIRAVLDPFLEEADQRWTDTPEAERTPTLPATDDGKVNVRELTRRLGLSPSREQHFYRHQELAYAVNTIAAVQGLKPIGSRALGDAADQAVSARMRRIQARSSELSVALSEREALIERLRQENSALREQLSLFEAAGVIVRTAEVV